MPGYQSSWLLKLIDQVSGPARNISKSVKGVDAGMSGMVDRFAKGATQIHFISSAIREFNDGLQTITAPAIAFEDSMAELQAITGVSGQALDDLGMRARRLAKTFGGDAAQAAETYKLILSKLGPDIAQSPEALDAMGRNIQLLSKTMGGDAVAATNALTSAMNQYGVDMSDPLKASEAMGLMMNVMSAAAKEGAIEVPQITQAIDSVGAAARSSGLSFEEMNAAIQSLDKAGKRGAEGGIALRNILSRLERGRFLPPDIQKELAAAGVDLDKLADKSLKFSDRLRELKKVQGDSALLAKLFGDENRLAGQVLIEQADNMDMLTEKISGTSVTTEQADIIMGTFSERMKRMKAVFSDWGIAVGGVTKKMLPFLQFGSQGLMLFTQLAPAAKGVQMAYNGLAGGIGKLTGGFKKGAATAFRFAKGLALSGLNALKAAGRFVIAAVSGIGSYIGSLITATAAQWGLNIAMEANPIGLIIAGIVALGAAIAGAVYLIVKHWDAIKEFLGKIWAGFKDVFGKVWGFIKKYHPMAILLRQIDKLFPGLKIKLKEWWDAIVGVFMKMVEKIKGIWDGLKGALGFGKDGKAEVKVTADGGSKNINDFLMQGGGQAGGGGGSQTGGGGDGLGLQLAGGGSGAGGKSVVMNLTINADFNIPADFKGNLETIKEQIVEMIVGAGRDASVAVG